MSRPCDQELCPMWDGDGCPCTAFGLDRNALPTDGVFTATWMGPGVDSLQEDERG